MRLGFVFVLFLIIWSYYILLIVYPGRYLPFLQELSSLPDPLRCYRVDIYLRRLPRALGHLANVRAVA